jgi:hypothetical protein
MFHKCLRVLAAALGLLAAGAIPSSAHTLSITGSSTCSPCEYSITVAGSSTPGATITVHYTASFTAQSTGITTSVTKDISVTVDANGNYNQTVDHNPSPVDCGTDTFTITAQATLFVGGVADTSASFGPGTLNCGTPPPPPGKTFGIGPSSMEGALQMRAGDWVSGGYSFKFDDGHHGATTYTVTASVTVPFTCPNGGGSGGNIFVNLGTKNYSIPAGNTDWLPTGDQNSILSWDGAVQAADGCSGNVMVNRSGAIFSATVSQNPPTGSLVDWRFKYRDPNAKGKGNVNCTDASDPRRNDAATCGASWSETVRDP